MKGLSFRSVPFLTCVKQPLLPDRLVDGNNWTIADACFIIVKM